MEQNNFGMFAANKPIRETTYEILKDAIISGELLPGERIVENIYAKQYNISRTPIREALRKLEQDGLVEYIARKGVIVRSLSAEDIREIYIIRQSLESLALEHTMKNITQADVDRLYDILDETATYVEKGNIEEASRNSRMIHVSFYQLSGLSRLQALIGSLDEYMDRFSFMILTDEDRREQSAKEHRQMVDALRDRDLSKLLKVNKQHLQRACYKCIEGYNERRNLLQNKEK